jgi:hypothetical protein
MNTQKGSTTFDGKREIELLRGPSLNKSTASSEAEKHRQPSNAIGSVSIEPACHHIHFEPSAPTEITKGVHT